LNPTKSIFFLIIYLKFDCNEKDEEIKYLSTFKEGYDRLDEDFIDQTSQPKETVVATKKV